MKNYSLLIDKGLYNETLIYIVILLVSVIVPFFLNVPSLVKYIGLVIVIALIFFCYAIAPKKYIVEDDFIKIKSLISCKKISIKDILSIQEGNFLGGATRQFAVGGMFSYTGKFHSKKSGDFYSASKSPKDGILITTDEGKFYLSPENKEEFIYTIKGND